MVSVKLFSIVLIISISSVYSADYCYSTDTVRSQHNRMCTKQAYQNVRGNPENYNTIPHCNPTQYYLVSRHGTRLPSTKTMILYRDQIPEIQARIINANNSTLCPGDLDLIANWKWDSSIVVENDQHLTEQGWDDLLLLGQAYRQTYPSVLQGNYSAYGYVVSVEI